MKTKVRKLLAIILTIAVCMSNMIMVSAREETETIGSSAALDWDAVTEEDSDVRITYHITSQWNEHYNVDVTLDNMTDERIDNWEICIPANYEIENIWNAKIIDHLGDEYTIHNAEWNQDISLEGSVSFGMTVKCSEEVKMPEYAYTTGLYERLSGTKYKVEFRKNSRWDDKFNGQIIITNLSEEKIEDWSLCLDSNFEIVQIWSAVVVDEDKIEDVTHYNIENPGYNQNIAPNQSVEFGFIAACKDEPEFSHLELYDVSSDIDLSEQNKDADELEFVDEFRLDSDSFETREEYEQYLEENGYTDEALMSLEEPEVFSRSRKSTKKVKKVVTNDAEDLEVIRRARPTQHYMPLSKGASYLMKAKLKDPNAYIMKRTVDQNKKVSYSKTATFEGFGHGQTFEQFTNSSNEEYYLLGGGATETFAKNLVVMSRSTFENKVLNHEGIKFNRWKDDGLFRIMTGLAKANKTGTKLGDLNRVDAALTADGSTLVIWKELQKKDKSKTYYEISMYNMRKIMKIFEKQRLAELKKKAKNTLKTKDKNQSLALSFTNESIKKACIGSFWEQPTTGKRSVLKPNDSFQSIDIEKYIENGKQKWRIAITSGNEIKRMKDATITRFEVEKSKKNSERENGVTYKAFRDLICLKNYEKDKLELEGGHIMNSNKYEFLAVKEVEEEGEDGKTENSRHVFLTSIDLLDIKTQVK